VLPPTCKEIALKSILATSDDQLCKRYLLLIVDIASLVLGLRQLALPSPLENPLVGPYHERNVTVPLDALWQLQAVLPTIDSSPALSPDTTSRHA
jgi:hypothetical protein